MPVFGEPVFQLSYRSVNKQGIKRRDSGSTALERFQAEPVLVNITFRKCLVGCAGKNKGEVSRDQSREDKKRDQQNNRQLPEHSGLVAEFDNQLVRQHNTGRGPDSRTYFSNNRACGGCGGPEDPRCFHKPLRGRSTPLHCRVQLPARVGKALPLARIRRTGI